MEPCFEMKQRMRRGRQIVALCGSAGMATMLIVGGTLGRHLASEIAHLAGM